MAIVRSVGNMSLKNQVTPPGIDPGTVRIVPKRLNNCATPGPDAQITCIKCEVTDMSTLQYRVLWEQKMQ